MSATNGATRGVDLVREIVSTEAVAETAADAWGDGDGFNYDDGDWGQEQQSEGTVSERAGSGDDDAPEDDASRANGQPRARPKKPRAKFDRCEHGRDAAVAHAVGRVAGGELDAETLAVAARDDEPIEARDRRDAKLCPRLDVYLGESEPDDDDSEDWNIRDVIPREPTLWGARMKAGKTWTSIDLAIAMALGEDWLGFENTRKVPINVLGIFIEDGKRRLRRRLWELCRGRGVTPNDERLREHLSITREPIRIPDDAIQIAKRLRGWTPAVIIIDNLTRVMVGDPNSTRDAAAFNKAWLQLGDELGAAVVILHHTRKTGGGEKDGKGRPSDPFDTLRGSGDFGAAARHLIVSRPLELEDGSACSEVFMRGNLDLRHESFVLGFERTVVGGRWSARLVNRGEVERVRRDAGDKRRALRDATKKAEAATEIERRRQVALGMVRTKGACSAYELGVALGLTDRGAAPVLKGLESSGVLRRDKARGYVFAEPDPAPATNAQPELPGTET